MKQVTNFFHKIINQYFIVLLIAIVVVSLGQMVKMTVWQDDQALFFKLAHINEAVGFFGKGPFGSGIYRYAATPFIPIYTLFGFNTVPYYLYILTLYAITTIVVYKTFSFVLNKSAGRVAGFLYAAGYLTSDGVYRMANSSTMSVSIILTCFCFASYWKFYKAGGIRFYLLALIFYTLSLEFAVTRMHYFILVLVTFELLFLAFKKPLKSILNSIIRLIPIFLIFYKYLILEGDSRSGIVKEFFIGIFQGKFYYLFNFLTSLQATFTSILLGLTSTTFLKTACIIPFL